MKKTEKKKNVEKRRSRSRGKRGRRRGRQAKETPSNVHSPRGSLRRMFIRAICNVLIVVYVASPAGGRAGGKLIN